MIKKIPLPIHLIFGFLFLMITPGQAVTSVVSEFRKEVVSDIYQKEKVNRLKNKLAKRMAKIASLKDGKEKKRIRRKANAGLLFGIIPFVLIIGSAIIGSLTVVINVAFFSAFLFGLLGFFFSWKALKKIKKSTNPEEYRKEKVKGKIGKVLSMVWLGIVILTIGAAIYILNQ